ncbi:hypothetical protein HY086_05740 [Candidatus Gottesmanbacteria bacterium]|nr:hypothetical protein [Candidatus Gottesmanbacteria bacterium]
MRLVSVGGYVLLILLAVLAPTPIPIPLDGIILGLIRLGYNPTLIIILALVGDVIGTFFIFVLAKKGRALYAQYRKRKKRQDYVAAQNLFHRWGKYSLLLSGVPFLGDALIFIAGFYRLHLTTFLLWFTFGKLLWYGLIIIPIVAFGQPFFPITPWWASPK